MLSRELRLLISCNHKEVVKIHSAKRRAMQSDRGMKPCVLGKLQQTTLAARNALNRPQMNELEIRIAVAAKYLCKRPHRIDVHVVFGFDVVQVFAHTAKQFFQSRLRQL